MATSTTATPTSPTLDISLLPPNCAHTKECLKQFGYLDYLPSIPANVFFLAFFGVALLSQILISILYLTRRRIHAWTFTLPVLCGLLLEIIGYGGRIGMSQGTNVFIDTYFIIYLCCLTIAPAFFSAAVYLSLSRIVTIYAPTKSVLKPRTITILFISCDILSLILQAVGGALASTANTPEQRDNGVNVMLAGLATQVAATTAFACVCLHLAWAVRRDKRQQSALLNSTTASASPTPTELWRRRVPFRAFLVALAAAVVTILIRCAFRCAELSGGFKGELANDETLFMVFDSAMMAICATALTGAHPAVTLGKRWQKPGMVDSTPAVGEKSGDDEEGASGCETPSVRGVVAR